jgi:hypothetical protein
MMDVSGQLGEFEVYYGSHYSTNRITGPDIDRLFSTARTLLLQSNVGLRHLGMMTFGDSTPSSEELEERIQDITQYLNMHFPVIRLLVLPKSYGITPNPLSLQRYRNYPGQWLAKSIEQRRTKQLEIYIHSAIHELHERSNHKQ